MTKPRAAVAAVVGADHHVAVPAQLLLHDHPLPRATADDRRDPHARGGQALGDGMHDRGADAAADAHGVAGLDELRGLAQRPRDIGDGVARPASAHRSMVVLPTAWMTSVMVPALGVRVGDGQRDALGARAEADDDELARLADQRDPRRRDDEPGDVGGELVAGEDRMHGLPR